VPSDDAGQRYCVEIADHCAHAGCSVDGIAILEASIVRSESVFDIECHPVSSRRPTVDQEHDAECNGIQNRERDCKPDAPVPFL
jgi:hypothetical protein